MELNLCKEIIMTLVVAMTWHDDGAEKWDEVIIMVFSVLWAPMFNDFDALVSWNNSQ